ncbi:MAG: hypothetical protein Q8Q56_00830 [Alphaproteobacteria bacterium]|nr:hypothetical protein [Alphaproteobacteria bacterium]
MSNYKPDIKCTRRLEWCKKKGPDRLEGKETIDHLSPELLINLLSLDTGNDPDLLYDYRVPYDKAYKLQPYVQHLINAEKYEYYIGVYAPS